MYDVAIIGCGIAGASAAYELSRYDLKVVVLEKNNDICDAATKANSAIIHSGYDPHPETMMAKFNVQGCSMAKDLCESLDVPYKQVGSLTVAFNDSELKTLGTLYERGLENGVPGIKLLNKDEVHSMEPNLSCTVTGALFAPSAGIVSPWEYGVALAEIAVTNGVELRRSSGVHTIEDRGDYWHIGTSGSDLSARYIVNCAGLYSDDIHNMVAPQEFKILPSKGEYFLLDKSEGERVNHVIFQCPSEVGKGVLVSPTVHGNLIVGPNAQAQEDKEDISNTAEGLAFVRSSAVRSVPSISFGDNIRNFAGIRANTDRDDFIIGSPVPRFIDIAGIKSPGLTAAPAIAVYAVRLLEDQGLVIKQKNSWVGTRKITRFNRLSPDERSALVDENPAYGRVVCRCETITEGEILDALRSPIPPTSIDGIKRRTFSGSGRCQGGFCGPRILMLMAREYGIPPETILQNEDGSFVLTGETKQGGI